MSGLSTIAGLFFLLATAGATDAAQQATGDALIVKDVTLISPERLQPLAHADVLIKDGRIAKIGADLATGSAQRIDGRGRFLIPGLIDSHVHVSHPIGLDDDAIEAHPELWAAFHAQLPRAYLAFGFTTLVDLDFDPRTRDWFDAGLPHPRLYSCGPGVRIAGGYPTPNLPKDVKPGDAPNLVYESAQAEHWPLTLNPSDYTAERAVERAVAAGAICVKVFIEPGFGGVFNWPIPRPETLSALHKAAAARHLPLIVHANALDAWQAALNAHAEIIAHGLWQWPGDRANPTPPPGARALIAEAARKIVFVQPTVQVIYGERSLFDPSIIDDPRFAMAMPRILVTYLHSDEAAKARRETAESYIKVEPTVAKLLPVYVKRVNATSQLMYADGVRLLLGTDTGGGEGVGNPPGLNGQLELQHWAEAGISPARILRAATLDNASAFGLAKELGSIAVGKRADLLLLSANPLGSVEAFDSIDTIILNGRAVQRDQLRPLR